MGEDRGEDSRSAASKMSALPTNIIHNIADWLYRLDEDDYARPISRDLSINRHWEEAMIAHTYSTIALFHIPEDLPGCIDWLTSDKRQGRVLKQVTFVFDTVEDYDVFSALLDTDFADVTFETIILMVYQDIDSDESLPPGFYPGEIEEEEFDLSLPRSLKTTRLEVGGSRGLILDFSDFSDYLSNNLKELLIPGVRYRHPPKQTQFQALEKLFMTAYNGKKTMQLFIDHHPSIRELSVDVDWRNDPFRGYDPVKRLRIPPNIKTLICSGIAFDSSENSQNIALSKLIYTGLGRTPFKWGIKTDCLESLVFSGCQVIEESKGILGMLDRRNRDKKPEDFFSNKGGEHEILQADKLWKFRNLKRLEIRHVGSEVFAQKFEEGFYDDAMPMLEEVKMIAMEITKPAFDRFVAKHPHVKVAYWKEGISVMLQKMDNEEEETDSGEEEMDIKEAERDA